MSNKITFAISELVPLVEFAEKNPSLEPYSGRHPITNSLLLIGNEGVNMTVNPPVVPWLFHDCLETTDEHLEDPVKACQFTRDIFGAGIVARFIPVSIVRSAINKKADRLVVHVEPDSRNPKITTTYEFSERTKALNELFESDGELYD